MSSIRNDVVTISVTKGFVPLPCNTYFLKILAILYIRKHVKLNRPPVIEILTDFLLINEISTAFY